MWDGTYCVTWSRGSAVRVKIVPEFRFCGVVFCQNVNDKPSCTGHWMRFWREILPYNKASRPRRNLPGPQPEVVGVFYIEKIGNVKAKGPKLCQYAVFVRKGVLNSSTRWRSWLRHCTTGRKVAGSFSDGAIVCFHWRNLRPHYGRLSLGDKGVRCAGLTNVPLSCADFFGIWEPQTLGTFRVCLGLYLDCFKHGNERKVSVTVGNFYKFWVI